MPLRAIQWALINMFEDKDGRKNEMLSPPGLLPSEARPRKTMDNGFDCVF